MIDKNEEVINNLHSFDIPKYYTDDPDMVMVDKNIILFHYFKSIKRLEYSVYTKTFPYTIFMIYGNDRLFTFSIDRSNIEEVLNKLLSSESIIKSNEFYKEYVKIKKMLNFLKNNLEM